MKRKYNLDEKTFEKMFCMSENVRNLIYVLKGFCNFLEDDEEVRNLIPLVNYVFLESDKLYSCFMNKKYDN